MTAGFLRDEDTGALVVSGAGGSVLVWDADSATYEVAERRVFVGPVDPSTAGFVLEEGDRWTPTAEPTP